ncbi:MAG TPA: peptide ABC transporter substrate-binding protein [Chloroflexota bacterium]|nr:peptide ABC transporter substrate-binding protein [Chloroflexota bacterium]
MQRSIARLLGWGLIGILLLNLLAACSAIGNVGDQIGQIVSRSGAPLRLSGEEPDTLDPAVAQDSTSWGYLLEIYGGLVRLDSQLKVVPDLASSWTVGSDGRTYTFHLRENAKFQDGRPITAADVKYSLERALDPATRSPVASIYLGDIVGSQARLSGQAKDVSGIVVVDPLTLRITIDAPKSYFLSKLTYPTAFVVDRRNVESGPTWFQHPNASGPYSLGSWQPGQKIVLRRNPNYAGNAPHLNEVDYDLSGTSPFTLFQEGKLDVATLGIGDVPRASDPTGPYHQDLISTPLMSFWYLGFNINQKPFDDPKVRLAFAYATDKKKLVDGLFRGTRTIANGVLPPGMLGFDQSYAGIPYDPATGRQMLRESSYGSATNLPPIVSTVGQDAGQIGEGFAEMYHNNLGVNITVEQDQTSFLSNLGKHQLQMFYIGWVADYPDPEDFLGVLFSGTSQGNDTGYNQSQVNTILAQASAETNPQKRGALYGQANALVVEAAPAIPLFFDTEYDLVRPSVRGLTITPLGIVSFVGVQVQ